MYSYHTAQWLAFFYLYSFLGWCFESSYVSLKEHRPVNRGFMQGPMLPLYGFGAVGILFSTIPVRSSWLLTFLMGMLTATLLEYVTGVVMETLFHVRYWDYSSQRFNFQGHICLSSSLAWGVLSLLLTKLHHFFETPVLYVPLEILTIIVLILTFLAAFDFSNAFRTAIDLKRLLANSEKLQAELLVLQSRAEQLEARLRLEKEEFLRRCEAERRELQEKADVLEARMEWEKEMLTQTWEDFSADFSQELQEIHKKQSIYQDRLLERITPDKLWLLRRNPSAVSKKHPEILEKIKQKHIRNDR